MKKKIAALVITAALMVGGATAVFAATDQSKLADLKSLYQQMIGTQKQIIDKQVDSGALTQAQADLIKAQMDQREKYMEQSLENGQPIGPGAGFGRGGMRFGQGFGPGTGGCGGFGGGYGAGAPGNPAAPTQN